MVRIKGDRKALRAFQHRIVQRADRELLRLAGRPHERYCLNTVAIIFGRDQRSRAAGRIQVDKSDIDIEAILHSLIQCDREQQPSAFDHRHVFDRDCRFVVVGDRPRRRVAVRYQRVAGRQPHGERLASFYHGIADRADSELLCLAGRPREVQYHRTVVEIFWSDQRSRATGGTHVCETHVHNKRFLYRLVQSNRKL